MLPPDIETADALAHLTVPPDRSPGGVGRRRFLQAVGLGLGGAVVGPQALAALVPGWEDFADAAPIGPTDGVLVVLLMGGGNDGLNMVVPTGDSAYYAQRGALAIPATTALPLAGGFGLHPSLTFVKERYDQGKVAVVRGVGLANPDLSHFTSMATWMQAWAPGGPPTSGWLGRWLDGMNTQPDPYRGISIGSGVPLHLAGATTKATAVGSSSPAFGVSTDANDQRMYQVLRDLGSASTTTGAWGDALARNGALLIETSAAIAPSYSPELPSGKLVKEMTLAARLINADLGVRVLGVSYGDFDSHANQPAMHDARMAELDAGLRAFFATLSPTFAGRTTVMTFSEFGRRLERNGSNGTDHGTASSLLLVGQNVAGGLKGTPPSLTALTPGRQLIATSDFRQVFATVLTRWLNADARQILGADYAPLDLFALTPGQVVPPPPPPVVTPTPAMFNSLVPSRIVDTRDGTGGTLAPVAAGSPRLVQVAGQGGIPPSGATAAVLNVTVTGATRDSWLTVSPSGVATPDASNLNFVAGQTVPNLVMTKLGGDGKVVLTNAVGSAHVVVDVVGYYGTAAGTRYTPLSPSRILDTRDGTGRSGARTPLGTAAIDLTVAGVGGVPATGVDAVVLNMTTTAPDTSSWLTVWPKGATQPNASNLNYEPNDTVPNLVVAKVGTGGKISIANARGSTHCIADVVGYFSATATAGRHLALPPARILDTRSGVGRTGTAIVPPDQPVELKVTGVGGVPATGVTAVVVNLTVTAPTTSGWLTVHPTGETRPTASNLNFAAGQTRANLVVAKVGTGGKISVVGSVASCHIVADVAGYFVPSP
ncbi:MAG: DUF1501 domain-containing protein [Acidimicrobiales bacterium]|nr:DUF1501 domain-containing protein [Acidimicrobiales bacterium]